MLGIGAGKQRPSQAVEALQGRAQSITPDQPHHVLGDSLLPNHFPQGVTVWLGMGCFWGAERIFWRLPGVLATAVGYAGGYTPNPTYREVCSGQTGHAEAVQVVYDPARISLQALLKAFWEGHDPTQGMRQGNDRGTQYRSAIYTGDMAQLAIAEASARQYQRELDQAGLPAMTTEIAMQGAFYYAESEHQQYLSKNPQGYCGLGGTGVRCPVALNPG